MAPQTVWLHLNFTSSRLLFFFFFFFFATSLAHKNCRSSCGDLRNVTYPFRFHGDSSDCGQLGLICRGDNKTVLSTRSLGFYVQAIYYDNNTIHLVYPDITNSSCHLPRNPLLLKNNRYSSHKCLDYAIYGSNPVATFVNCSSSIKDQRYIPITCPNQETNGHLYLIRQQLSYAYELRKSCRFVAEVPSLAIPNGKVLSWAQIQPMFQMGFDLRWRPSFTTARISFIEAFRAIGEKISFCYHAARSMWCMARGFVDLNAGIQLPFYYTYYAVAAPKLTATARVLLFIVGLLPFYVLWILIARFVLAPLCTAIYLIHKLQTFALLDTVEKFLQKHQTLVPTRFTYSDIIIMTGNLKQKLGQGGFGSVYKGKLPNNSLVAIKFLSDAKSNGDDFINEVSTIGRIHHVNIVKLVGFCSEGSKRALIYELMNNGSLDKYIFSAGKGRCQSLGWEKLYEITLGIAHGIEYLHRGCDMRILHFDIKPHNILLDDHFMPKISDFGLAKMYSRDFSYVSVTGLRGTVGYIAPEVFSRNFGQVSYKSDVYSFGMMLLDIVGARKDVNANAENSSIYFPQWIYDRINQGEYLGMGDKIQTANEIARKLIIVGLWCIQMKPIDRPSMTKVVEMLEGNLEALQMPRKPFFSSHKRVDIGSTPLDDDCTEDSIICISE